MSHVKFEFHFNRDILTYFTAKNRSKSFFCIHGLKNHIRASDLVHTHIVSFLTSTDYRHGWAISCLGQTKHSEGGVSRAPSQRTAFWTFFNMLWDINLKLPIHILVGSATHQVRVSSQSGHSDLLYSQEWVKVFFLHLWPHELYRAFRFGTCDRCHVLILNTVNYQGIHWCWQTGVFGSLWLLLLLEVIAYPCWYES